MVLPGTDKFDGSTMFGSCAVIEQEYDESVNGSGALANLPKALLPSVLVDGTPGSGALGSILLEQRRCENVAFCRTMSAVYALFRDRYGERESAFLSSDPIGGADFYAVRRELSLAYEAVKAEVSVTLRIGPAATETVIEQAVGFVERLPRVFALVGRNVLSPRGGTEALSRARALTGGQAIEFDELLAELLAADPLALISVPALREAADRLVHEIDPVAAERRRRMAEEDRRVTFRPAEDGMAAAYALLTAHEGLELGVRVDEIAGTVCESDPRTVPQRRADGLMMLVRGFSTLGCWCAVPGCPLREARAVGDDGIDDDHPGARVVTRYRTLIHVVVNEKTLTDPGDTDAGFLIGHGPITAQHARDLAARDDAVLRPFGQELPATDDPTAAAPPATAVVPVPDADHAPAQPPTPASSPRRPRSAWFRATGIDLTHREPASIQLAARCCHTHLTVIDAPGSESGLSEGLSPEQSDPPATTVSRTPVPAADQNAAAPPDPGAVPPAPTAVRPRALVIAQGSTGYRFSADLTRYLTLLYPRCVFPLCTRPASRCQLDHAREYDHHDPTRGGATIAGNGQPLCIPHHQLKTAGLWTDARLPDGRILWIGPTCQRIIVDPTRTIAALFPDLTRITWTTPTPTERRKPPPPSGPTRLQKEHARRERLRAAHLDALTREREERERVSPVEHHLETVLAGRDPAHHPPPDEPPPF
ncbi:DUF222 domain-containing protein [Tsukamurella tyrosinosolvens]|uniref:HNH endonuclease signature motif containing protein n=1 Tax=Tsukamurella tyrosinosolvens TaxID=57704 RepID=UPI001AFC8E96|nr:HNH endonuclease signature motif containing protein [Tsukamurella tyrosinosolvens]QRY84556.1 DUF222 domain-containing protein [Tsukamurella tyrosinosolvens]